MNIRKATIKDVDRINAIYNQAVEKRFSTAHLEPVSHKERLEWFKAHDPDKFPLFVYEENQQVVGWISLSPYRKDRQALFHVAEISYYVHQDFHGFGVGSRLMSYAIEKSQQFGFTVLIAILLNRNPASIALLKKFGFREWGNMPGIAIIDGITADHLYYGLKMDSAP